MPATDGATLRAWRLSRGWDVPEMARQLRRAARDAGVVIADHDGLIRMIRDRERSRHGFSERYLLLYCKVFDVALDDFPRGPGGSGDARPDAWRTALEWLATEPPQTGQLRAGRHVGTDLAAEIEHRVQELRILDDHLGGADTLAAAERELEATGQLVTEGAYTEATGRRLYVALADLHQIAGWITSDAGQYDGAEGLYLDGVRAAHTGGDNLAAGNLLSSLAYQTSNVGRPDDAVLLARAAVSGARGAEGRPRALLLDRLAWASARAGDRRSADRALDEADEAYGNRTDGEAEWTYWLDRGEMDIMRARCMTELRRPLKAVPLLESILDGYPADRVRETALYRSWLAEAYAQANEIDAARETYAEAAALAAGVRSERLHARLRTLAALIGADAPS
jgi:tetratricopeptide (TPR) repeat protein